MSSSNEEFVANSTPSDACQVSSDEDLLLDVVFEYRIVGLDGEPSDGEPPMIQKCDREDSVGSAIAKVRKRLGDAPPGQCYRLVWQGSEGAPARTLDRMELKLHDLFDGHDTLDERTLVWVLTDGYPRKR